ncbi:MAG TPA: PilZ domain-containing protein [Alphaproteobacteria bacterium]
MQIIADGAKGPRRGTPMTSKPQEAADRRTSPRVQTTANDYVTFNNVQFPLRNWSGSGLLFGPMGSPLDIGQKLTLKVTVRCGDDRLRFDADCEVARVANGLVAVRYQCLSGDTAARIRDHFSSDT